MNDPTPTIRPRRAASNAKPRLRAVAASLCLLLMPAGAAGDPVPPPLLSYSWEGVEVGDVLTAGVVEEGAAGVAGCDAPGFALTIHVPAGTPEGSGRAMTTELRVLGGAVCQVVVASKTLVSGADEEAVPEGDNATEGSEAAAADPVSFDDPARGAGGTGGPSSTNCSPNTRAAQATFYEGSHGTMSAVAKLRYAYNNCSVSYLKGASHCTWSGAYHTLGHCQSYPGAAWHGTNARIGDYEYNVWRTLDAKARGHASGAFSCAFWSQNAWSTATRCVAIPPSSV